jgi:hypothetical protein
MDRAQLQPDWLVPNRTAKASLLLLRVRCPALSEPSARAKKRTRELARLGVEAEPTACDWRGTLEALDAHTSNSCVFIVVPCSMQGCSERVPRGKLAAHTAACEHRPVECPHCARVGTAQSLDYHLERCREREFYCEHDECGALFKLKDLDEHYETCAYTDVDCPVVGCTHRPRRRELDAHLHDGAASHLMLLQTQLLQTQSALQTATRDASVMRAELTATTARLGRACEQLRDARGYIGELQRAANQTAGTVNGLITAMRAPMPLLCAVATMPQV